MVWGESSILARLQVVAGVWTRPPLPDALQPDQILAVMGGPMGVADLGAQLLANAATPVGFEPGLP